MSILASDSDGNPKLQKPDFTAWFVLQGVIAAMHQPEFYDVKNEDSLKLYKILALEAGKTRLMSRLIHRLPYSWQYKIGDFVTNKGRLRHFYLRKKEIENTARELLSGGDVEQVIVLGAGLDVLALRLAKEYSGVRFIEIDREESQQFKRHSLSKHNVRMVENVEFLVGDLRNPLSGIMESSRFYDANAKTLWVIEGVLMFMPEESAVGLFRQIKEGSKPASSCIFTTLALKEQGSALAKTIQKLYLRKEKCQFNWTVSYKDIPEFVAKLDFVLIKQINCDMLHKGHESDKNDINHDIGDDIHVVKTAN